MTFTPISREQQSHLATLAEQWLAVRGILTTSNFDGFDYLIRFSQNESEYEIFVLDSQFELNLIGQLPNRQVIEFEYEDSMDSILAAVPVLLVGPDKPVEPTPSSLRGTFVL